jgi:hypothetical protein
MSVVVWRACAAPITVCGIYVNYDRGSEFSMKTTTITALLLLAATGTAPAVVVGAAPIASADADPVIHDLGERANLVNGSVVQRWTPGDLKPSTDEIAYPVQGALWGVDAPP